MQIAYFKAKHAFFHFAWDDAEEDCAFILSRYFSAEAFSPQAGVLDFAGVNPSHWLAALAWAKGVFAKQQRLSQRPLAECSAATLPKRLRPYLLTFDAEGEPIGVHADRYEFWL